MFVKLWMTKEVITISPDQPVEAASLLMRQHKIRRLPVVESGKLSGIICPKDIDRAMPSMLDPTVDEEQRQLAGQTKVQAMMAENPVTVAPDDTIEQAARKMSRNKIGGLPVVQNEKLVGVITETNIFNAFIDVLGSDEAGARIELKIDHQPDSFYTMLELFKRFGMTIEAITVLPDFSRTHRLVTLRVTGENLDDLIDELWDSGLQINRILRDEE